MYRLQNKILTFNGHQTYGKGVPVFPSTGLVAYYRFEEASGNIVDAIGTKTGTASNLTYQQTGKKNYAVSFNGSSSKVDYGNVYNYGNTQAFSYSAWIKTNTNSGYHSIISNLVNGGTYRGCIDLNIDGTNVITNIVGTWSANRLNKDYYNVLTDTNWHLFTVTYDGSKSVNGFKFYKDAVKPALSASVNNLTDATNGTGTLYIGYRVTNHWWNGLIDEVCIWNRELSQDEVTTLYNSGTGLFY